MKDKKVKKNKLTITDNKMINSKDFERLYNNISIHIEKARNSIIKSVNTEMVEAYWLIGRDIVEYEQKGEKRAEYGATVLQELSDKLTKQHGRGFSVDTLERIRKFYILYPCSRKSAALQRKFVPAFSLSWIHYRALMSEDRKIVRDFYEVEAIKNCWSGRELERQMGSLLFERLARSKDKKGLLKLANKGHEIIKPEDAIKDPIILEFLDIPESHKLVELKLEEAPYSTSCLYDYRFKDQTINTR